MSSTIPRDLPRTIARVRRFRSALTWALGLVGLGAIAAGAFLIHTAAGLVVAGAAAVGLALLLDPAFDRPRRRQR